MQRRQILAFFVLFVSLTGQATDYCDIAVFSKITAPKDHNHALHAFSLSDPKEITKISSESTDMEAMHQAKRSPNCRWLAGWNRSEIIDVSGKVKPFKVPPAERFFFSPDSRYIIAKHLKSNKAFTILNLETGNASSWDNDLVIMPGRRRGIPFTSNSSHVLLGKKSKLGSDLGSDYKHEILSLSLSEGKTNTLHSWISEDSEPLIDVVLLPNSSGVLINNNDDNIYLVSIDGKEKKIIFSSRNAHIERVSLDSQSAIIKNTEKAIGVPSFTWRVTLLSISLSDLKQTIMQSGYENYDFVQTNVFYGANGRIAWGSVIRSEPGYFSINPDGSDKLNLGNHYLAKLSIYPHFRDSKFGMVVFPEDFLDKTRTRLFFKSNKQLLAISLDGKEKHELFSFDETCHHFGQEFFRILSGSRIATHVKNEAGYCNLVTADPLTGNRETVFSPFWTDLPSIQVPSSDRFLIQIRWRKVISEGGKEEMLRDLFVFDFNTNKNTYVTSVTDSFCSARIF